MRPLWNAGVDESPSLRPRRKSGEARPRRKSGAGDVSIGVRKASVGDARKGKVGESPKRPSVGSRGRSYGSLGLGRPGTREREGIPMFGVEEGGLGLNLEGKGEGGPLVASTSANSFLGTSSSTGSFGSHSFLGVPAFMRNVSSGTFSGSDGEASVNGTPTRRGSAGVLGLRGGVRSVQPRQSLPMGPKARVSERHSGITPAAARPSLPMPNWRLVTPSPSLSSLASSLTDTPSAPARKARASPILSKGKRPPPPTFHPATEPEPTMVLGRLEREYTTVQQIGKGTFGQVLKVEKDGRLFAVKRSKAFEGVRHRRRILEEVDILQHLSASGGHPNVLRFVDAWEQDGRSLILTEMCELGNLADFLVEWGERFARLDESRVWKITSDLSQVCLSLSVGCSKN